MPRRRYTKRDATPGLVFEGRYLVEEKGIEILISTCQDGNMDLRLSEDAKNNYRRFLEKYGVDAEDSFSPALGQNYRIITIDEFNEERFSGRFIENGDSREEYRCDAVIVCNANIPVAFRVGDCPVVLIVGKSFEGKTVMALVHAGRAELQEEMLKDTVARMASDYRMHILPATAYVFPHICKRCYKLEFLNPTTKEKASDFLKFVDEHCHLDLMGWLKRQLNEAGIQRISTAFFRCTAGISPVCVSRRLYKKEGFEDLFFSHYKSFHQNSLKGRFLVVARIVDRDHEDEEI